MKSVSYVPLKSSVLFAQQGVMVSLMSLKGLRIFAQLQEYSLRLHLTTGGELMKELILNDKAYRAFLKPYYENKTRVNATFGSLFSVSKEGLSDDELKKYISVLIKDYLEVALIERCLYYRIKNTFSLPPNFYLDDHTISFNEDEKSE